MMISSILAFLFSAIVLDGATGQRLSSRASFDANNVRVGDPLTLTVDFIGNAEFQDIHPPALSREVDRKIWKVDDASAKTDTGEFSRSLVYRVRPLCEGLHYFPALEFEYSGLSGEKQTCFTRPIPLHVKPGVQAALAGLDESNDGLPMPDGILIDVKSVKLSDDEIFAWRKACGRPLAKTFAKFDFPEARLNEAACHVIDGNWAKAMKIYSSLEWQTGQTPTIERGIVAALARKHSNPSQDLPAWRQVLRPVLRHAWPVRAAIFLSILVGAFALYFATGRLIRIFAALSILLLWAAPVSAQSMFDEIERMHQQMMERMNSMMNFSAGPGMTMTINGQPQEPVAVEANVSLSTNDVRVGETFRFIVEIESPRAVTLDQIRFTPSEMFGMVAMGKVENLADGKSANPSNRVRRISVPVRYDVPFNGEMTFRVDGMVTSRRQDGRSSFSFSQSFAAISPPVQVEIKPLPSDGQPDDFFGIIGSGMRLIANADRTTVETNDVVRLTCTLEYESGYVPPKAIDDIILKRPGRVVWQKYFVADGAGEIVPDSIVCYDTAKRGYERISARPVKLSYTAVVDADSESVAVDADDAKRSGKMLSLHFAPSEDSPVIERVHISGDSGSIQELETRGDWVRVETSRHAGWVKRKEGETK